MSDFWNNLTASDYEPNASLHIIIMLLVAFLLGYLLRFFIGQGKKTKDNSEELKASNSRLRDELDAVKRQASSAGDVKGLRAELDLVRKKNRELEKELGSKSDGGSSAELDALRKTNDKLNKELEDMRRAQSTAGATAMAASAKPASKSAKPADPDDLTKVEGVGKKIQEHLNNGGIWTFDDMAGSKVSRIQDILDAAGPAYTMHDPGTWPEQAAMARDGQWEKLEKWQSELKGGRKRKKRK